TMRMRRGGVPDRQLGRGPGNVGEAMEVLLTDVGDDLFTGEVFDLEPGEPPAEVWSSPRIGISRAVDNPWRCFDPTSRAVSVHRRGDPASYETIREFIESLKNPLE